MCRGRLTAGGARFPEPARLLVFDRDAVRALAEAIVQNARHNVAYFPGSFETLRRAIE